MWIFLNLIIFFDFMHHELVALLAILVTVLLMEGRMHKDFLFALDGVDVRPVANPERFVLRLLNYWSELGLSFRD